MEKNNINLQNQDYYSDTPAPRKIIDFIFGYFGFFVVILVLFFCTSFLSVIFHKSSGFLSLAMLIGVMVAIGVVNIIIKRKYISKGINFALLTLILIPILLLGSCLIRL